MKISKALFIVAGVSAALISVIGCTNKLSDEENQLNKIKVYLSEICSPVKISMTTPDTIDEYIELTPQFDFLVKLGEPTLNFFINEYKENPGDANRQYVMAYICSKILKEDPSTRTWTTGKEWFESHK
ncbi:MAG: hypothetical protein ACRC7N_02065 [Clostridium sp.]